MKDLEKLFNDLKNKYVEVYLGDQFEEIQMSDYSVQVNSCIYGKLLEIANDFLVLDCFYVDRSNEVKSGNIIYINAWQVRALTQINNNGSLNDAFLSINHISKIKSLIKNG